MINIISSLRMSRSSRYMKWGKLATATFWNGHQIVRRCFHQNTDTTSPNVRLPYPNLKNAVKVTTEKNLELELHPVWLRHHCQCEKCFNSKTYQRITIPSKLATASTIQELKIISNTLKITWNDNHKTSFTIPWLEINAPKKCQEINSIKNSRTFTSYNYPEYPEAPLDPLKNAIDFHYFMRASDGVEGLLKNIIKYGYGIVKDVPPNFETTKEVVLRISHPQNTIFGNFSEWTSDLAHADTAYTSHFVHLHADTSYFSEPMGLQMFHCLKHEGSGGINLIQDSFKIAKKLQQNFPDLHKALSENIVPFQYLDPGKHHFYSIDTIFKHSVLTGAIERVRYNPHDMAAINTISAEQVGLFYNSLVTFSNEVESNPVEIKLLPGLVIFLDNWRVFHGRTEFTGFRHMAGAYISRSDWLSKARVLGVINYL